MQTLSELFEGQKTNVSQSIGVGEHLKLIALITPSFSLPALGRTAALGSSGSSSVRGLFGYGLDTVYQTRRS